jgi:CBS domain-containing protein
MGDQAVNRISGAEEMRNYTRFLLKDIMALEKMLSSDMFETGIQRIGAEQELVLLDKNWKPSMNNLEILEAVNEKHYTTEIARFNLEINLDPFEFKGNCFQRLDQQLRELLELGKAKAKELDTKVMLTGILPTLTQDALHFEYMTPNPRYEALNEVMRSQKGGDFELNIEGIDELLAKHPNILFEACNTSFQIHLQIEPRDFVEQYNWAQLISGPVMSVSTNSPLLMGKRLWSETRIALFQQSVDARSSKVLQRSKEPRVTFGKAWLKDSVVNLFKDNVSRYNFLFSSDGHDDSLEILEKGEIPKLGALTLHNGTVYKWNRPCYGISNGKPHLRIENRYIPSGPTVDDEIANAVFWLGLMKGMPEAYQNLPDLMPFEDARYNFYNAARRGLDCQFNWFGKLIPARRLLEKEIIPMAYSGLDKMNISEADITKYMDIIQSRVRKNQNGSSWMLKNFSELLKGSTAAEANLNVTKKMYENQELDIPVHKWNNLDPMTVNQHKEFRTVNEIMESDLFTVQEDDLLDLVVHVMDWQQIRHVPVENSENQLVGLINSKCIIRYLSQKNPDQESSAKDIMLTEFPTISPLVGTHVAIRIMAENRVDALPVVDENFTLLGIITESDIVQVAHMTERFSDK